MHTLALWLLFLPFAAALIVPLCVAIWTDDSDARVLSIGAVLALLFTAGLFYSVGEYLTISSLASKMVLPH